MPVCPNASDNIHVLIKELISLNNKHRIISTLSGLNLAIDYTEKKMSNKNIYYVIVLDYSIMKVNVYNFRASELEAATQAYAKIEKEPKKNVVLVSASSFKTLREAYPNYFADISGFIQKMRDILKKYDN